MANIFKLVGNIVVDNDKAISQIKETEDQATSSASKIKKKFRSSMKSLGKWAKRGAAVGATAMAGLTVSSIKQFTKFDEKMREVYTLIPDASEDMKEKLSTDIRDIGKQFGFLTDDTVPALYQALSAGVPPENVMSFMKTAAKSAKAGVTDLQTSVDGLTSAVNAYGEEVLNAKKASDIMFTAVKEGKTTYEELAANMSNVTPIAASLGVRFEDINAALATMTAQGMDTGKATIYLRAMLNQLSKSGSDANDVFKEMAGQTFTEFIDSGHSLADALELMEEYADENNTTIKKLFSNVRAGTGALQLTGSNMETFIENLSEMEDSAGSTEEAYTEMSESVQQTLDELRSWWENQRIAIGEKLEEPLRDLLEWLRSNEGEIADLLQNTFQGLIDSLKWLVKNKSKVVSAVEAIGMAFVGWEIGALVSNLWGLAAVLGVIGGLGLAKAIREINKAMRDSWGTDATKQHRENIQNMNDAVADHKETLKKLESTLSDFQDQRQSYIEQEKEIPGWLEQTISSLERQIEAQKEQIATLQDWKKAERDAKKTTEDVANVEENLSGIYEQSAENMKERLKSLKDRLGFLKDMRADMKAENIFADTSDIDNRIESIQTLITYLEDQVEAQKEQTDATEDQTSAVDKSRKAQAENRKEVNRLTDETKEATDQTTAREKALAKLTDQREEDTKELTEAEKQEQNAIDIKEERLALLKREIAKAKALGEEYDETEMRAKAYKDIVEKLIDAGLENTKVYDKIIGKLQSMQVETETATEKFEEFWKSNQEWIGTVKSAFMDFFDKINEEGKSTAEALKETFVENADEIAEAIATAATGSSAVGKATNWLVDLGKAAWDWLFGPSERQKRINKMAKNLKSSIGGSIQSAFSADTYQGFVEGFGESLESIVKSKLIQAFVTTGAMKDKIKQLSNYMAEAVADRTLDQGEKDKIRSMYKGIVEQTKPIYEMISDFNLGGTEAEPQSLPRGVRTALNRFRAGFEQIISSQSPGGRTITASEEAKISQYKQQLESQQGINIDLSDITIRSEQDIEDLAQRIYELFNDKKESGGELGPLANVARI